MTRATCSPRAAANSSASARGSRPSNSGLSSTCRICSPAGVPPGSRVRTTAWPAGRERSREPALLRRLARSLAALEGDEVARRRLVSAIPAAAVFLAVVFFAVVFFAAVFLAAAFFTTRFVVFFGREALERLLRPPLGQQVAGPLDRDRRRVVGRAQRRVGGAVGDVGAEAAVLDHHRQPGRRVVADLAQRRLRLRRGPRCLGWANSASACSSVTVKISSSPPSERESLSFVR